MDYFCVQFQAYKNLHHPRIGKTWEKFEIVSISEKKVSAPVPNLDLGFGRTLVHSAMLSIFTAFQCLYMIGLFSATTYLMNSFFITLFNKIVSSLLSAFQQMGFRFSPTFVQNLLAKYDPKTRRLSLDNFIVACVQIQRLTTSFKTRDREMRGQATMAYEDFVGIALGAHNWFFPSFCKDFSSTQWRKWLLYKAVATLRLNNLSN